jgi:hypothetical protein
MEEKSHLLKRKTVVTRKEVADSINKLNQLLIENKGNTKAEKIIKIQIKIAEKLLKKSPLEKG